MMLIEFLNRQRTETLQQLEYFWTDSYRASSSKAALISRLRRAMLDPESLARHFQALPSSERRLLEIALRSADQERLAMELDALQDQRESGALRMLIENLADKGFIEQKGDSHAGGIKGLKVDVNEELAEALRKLLQDDFRHPEQLLSLESYLLDLSEQELAEILRDSDVNITGTELSTVLDWYLDPDGIRARIGAIEDEELRLAVLNAVQEHGGLLPLDKVNSITGALTSDKKAAWKKELEQKLLGTVDSLSLTHLGINVRSEYVILFLEVTIAFLKGLPEEPEPGAHKASSSGFKLLLDFNHILYRAQREDLRINKSGTLRKHGAEEALKSLLLADEKRPKEGIDYLNALVELALEMNLLQRIVDGTLTPTLKAMEWNRQDIATQLQALFEPIVLEAKTGQDSKHGVQLCRDLRDLCTQLRPGLWYKCRQASSIALARYLLKLVRGTDAASQAAYSAIYSSPVSLNHLADDFCEWVLAVPARYGLVDLATREGQPDLLRITPVAERLFGLAPPTRSPVEHNLIVNPDFEILLFPAENSPETHCLIHTMATLTKIDQVYHYRLEESSVITAAALGISAEKMVQVLDEHCRGPLPQNVRYSIESWAGRIVNVTVEQVFILELARPELVQQVRRLPEILPLVLRELSPTCLALKQPIEDRAAIKALLELGIYVRRGND